MRRALLSIPLLVASFAPSVASADVAPDPDPLMACQGKAIGDSCFADDKGNLFDGTCQEQPCADDMTKKCLVCTEAGTGSTGAVTTGAGSTGAATSGGSSGGESGSSGSSGEPPDAAKSGCGCSSAGSHEGALALLALLGLARRRRS